MVSQRRRFSPASRVSICDRCYAFSIRSVIRHGKSLRTRCEPAMAKRNSANSISASRRFSPLAWNPSPARARRRWRQVTTSAATIRFSMSLAAPALFSLRSTLFELPGPCAVARQKLANLPEGSRIDIVEGDVFKDALPAGYDALIVANTAHVFSVPRNIELLRKMRTGVQPGARLLFVDLWTDPSHTQPGPAALISGEFLVISGEGQAYSEQEADTWLGQTGWRKIEKTPLAGPTSLIVAEAV